MMSMFDFKMRIWLVSFVGVIVVDLAIVQACIAKGLSMPLVYLIGLLFPILCMTAIVSVVMPSGKLTKMKVMVKSNGKSKVCNAKVLDDGRLVLPDVGGKELVISPKDLSFAFRWWYWIPHWVSSYEVKS